MSAPIAPLVAGCVDPAQLHRLLDTALDDVLAALPPLVRYPSKDPS